MALTDSQVQDAIIELFKLIGVSRLPSELQTIAKPPTKDHYLHIQKGEADGERITVEWLRGALGAYNATTNTPILQNGTGTEGDSYIVSAAGARDFGNGLINLSIDDVLAYRNGKWVRTGFALTKQTILDTLGFIPEDTANRGITYPTLDENRKVPISQTYGGTSEVIEGEYIDPVTFNDDTGTPVTPTKSVIYLDKVQVPNAQYRWGGTQFIKTIQNPGSTDGVAEGDLNLYFTTARVLETLLTGLSTANVPINSADTAIAALGKLQGQISALAEAIATSTDFTIQREPDFASFPLEGFEDTLYVDEAENKAYLWDDFEGLYFGFGGGSLTAQAITDALTYTPANDSEVVKSVNGITPDEVGNVNVASSGGTTASTELVSFTANYQSGLTYNPAATFKEDGVTKNDSRSITADAADPSLDRFDLFVIDLTVDQIVLIKGTPASNPLYPEYDPLTQIPASFISIQAGATTPTGIVGVNIWTEGSEWSTTGAGSSFNFLNTETPASGTYAIKVVTPLTNGQALPFTAPVPKTYEEGMEITYKIKNISGGLYRWLVAGTKANGRQTSLFIDAPFNYSASSTVYQSLSVAIPSGIFANITKISLVSGVAGLQYYLDDVKLVSGGGSVTGNYVTPEQLEAARLSAISEANTYTDAGGNGSGIQIIDAGAFTGEVNLSDGNYGYHDEYISGTALGLLTVSATKVFGSQRRLVVKGDLISDVANFIPVGARFSGALSTDPAKINEITFELGKGNVLNAVSRIFNYDDTQAPTSPTSLTSSNTTSSSTDLSWTAATDNVAVVSYNIYKDGVFEKNVTTNSGSVTGLTATTSYSFTISALDGAGNESAQSTALVVNTTSANNYVNWEQEVDSTDLGNGTLDYSTISVPSGWAAGAYSTLAINGNNALHFKAEAGSTQIIALSDTYTGIGSGDLSSLDIAIVLRTNGTYQVLESGVSKFDTTGWVGTDILSLRLNNGSMTFEKNGTVIYTSALTFTLPLTAIALFNKAYPDAKFTNVEFENATNLTASPL